MQCNIQTCGQAIVQWPSVIVTTYCRTPKLGRGSNVGSAGVGGGGLCRVASGFKIEHAFLGCYERAKHDKDLTKFVPPFDGLSLPDLCPSLFILRHPCSHLNFAQRFDYLRHDCDLELYLHLISWVIFLSWHTLELFGIPLAHHLSYYIETPGYPRKWEGSRRSRVPTPPDSASSFVHSLKHPSPSGFGLAFCNVWVRGTLVYLVPSVSLHWYQGVCFWW